MKVEVYKGTVTLRGILNFYYSADRRETYLREVNVYGSTIKEFYTNFLKTAELVQKETIVYVTEVFGQAWDKTTFRTEDNWKFFCGSSFIYPETDFNQKTVMGGLIHQPFDIVRVAFQALDMAHYQRSKELGALPAQSRTGLKKEYDSKYWRAKDVAVLQEYSYTPEELQELWSDNEASRKTSMKARDLTIPSFPTFPGDFLGKVEAYQKRKQRV